MNHSFSAILYDMDGLLIDTEQGFQACDSLFFQKRNIVYDPLFVGKHLKGNSMRNGTLWLQQTFQIDEPFEQLLEERMTLSEHMFHTVPLKQGAKELVEATKQSTLKTAIASGNTMDRINQIVQRYHWQDHFDALVSTDYVEYKGKPHPDVFLYAANMLGVNPASCLVLEDAANGVAAAKAAGMKCIAVREHAQEELEAADIIVDSLHDPIIYEWLGIEKNSGI